MLSRWGAWVPASRVHVVCCPPPGGRSEELWQLFAGVVGFDPGRFAAEETGLNGSLGVVEIDLLRRVNVALDKRLGQPAYGAVVKQLLRPAGAVRPHLAAAPGAHRDV